MTQKSTLPALTVSDDYRMDPDIVGYRLLLHAIVSRAIFDAFGTFQEVAPRTRREALQWLLSYSETPFSFKWICDILEIPFENRRAMVRAAHIVLPEKKPINARLRGSGSLHKPRAVSQKKVGRPRRFPCPGKKTA